MTTPTHDSKGRPIVGWAVEGQDLEMIPGSIQEAVEQAFEDPALEALPESATIRAHVRRELPTRRWIADDVLQRLYEDLDVEFDGREEGVPQTPSSEVDQAALELADAVRKTYVVYSCVPTDVTITVDPRDFISDGE